MNQKIMNTPQISYYKYLNLLAIFYALTQITTVALAYRLIELGPFVEPGGILIFPMGYIISDIIAEIYGYKIAKQIIWITFFAVLAFSLLTTLVINFPIPSIFHNDAAYQIVFGNSIRSALAQILGVAVGGMINIRAIAVWKMLIKGRYFWLRSIGANLIGEGVTTIIIALLLFSGKIQIFTLANVILNMYMIKMIYVLIMVVPASICVALLNVYEDNNESNKLTINPFLELKTKTN